ncbi:glycoside hydrolase family 43 protein [Chryseolinea lacunae]|uniref:Family 43 glycosylhydrolase n=1 Tax=Chryseolinea lacunae TaxID=2801331 RepID=A0ABS1L1U5_9BACT|nr:glycoside hydrolase family 43 protein [Chryseolinea lacunae]MBL0745661.1 family 43 glycosylhydrolase [Chryseolinea lacunae]
MKVLRISFFLILSTLSLCVTLVHGQGTSPVIAGDFADPSIIKAGGAYYAVGTSSEWAPHFPIYRSTDLKAWTQTGYVFDKLPGWTSGSFWAPEYFFHNNTYYLYYTARRKSDNVSCIGVATSKYPDKDFKDQGIVVAYGKEAIDGFVFKENSELFITFKAYGLDNHPIELLGSKLSADGLKMEGEVFSLLKDDERIGMEGQSLLKRDGVYYLFYSAGNCCGAECSYNVNVAKANNIKGPYEKRGGTPLLQEDDFWKCSGHGTFVNAADDTFYYLYHAYNKRSNVFTGRQGMLASLTWNSNNAWPSLTPIAQPEKTPDAFYDSFNGTTLAVGWQRDFRNASVKAKQQQGKLFLSGEVKATNPSGVALAVRPASDVFEMETTVVNSNAALKGLVFYGDANAAIGVGVVNDKVELWMVRENKRVVLGTATIRANLPVKIKFATYADRTCKAFYKQQTGDWTEISASALTTISYLPPWDRSPRAGLHFSGPVSLDAQFDEFVIRY